MKWDSKKSEELLSRVKSPGGYGVHLGPYDDGRLKWRTRLLFNIGLKVVWGIAFKFYRSSKIGIIGGKMEDEVIKKYGGIVYAFWHHYSQYYFFYIEGKRHIMMISPKDGGEFGSRCMAKIGVIAVRGAPKKISARSGRVKDKKGREALSAMVRLVRDESFHAGMAVDGSKGPLLKMKIGAVSLARETGSPIIVLTAAAKPHFRILSWDRMWMPAPRSKIVYFFTGPFFVPKGADYEEMEEIRLKIEEHMIDMYEKGVAYFKDESIRASFPEPKWI